MSNMEYVERLTMFELELSKSTSQPQVGLDAHHHDDDDTQDFPSPKCDNGQKQSAHVPRLCLSINTLLLTHGTVPD